MRVAIFFTTFVRNIYLSKTNSARYDQWPSCTVPVILVSLSINLEFSRQIFEYSNIKFHISWKSVQWEPSCSIRVDGRTVMTKLTVAFRNSANAPHNNTRDVFFHRIKQIQSKLNKPMNIILYSFRATGNIQVRLTPTYCTGI